MFENSETEIQSRRFARACHRVMSGVTGRDIKRFYKVVLTTRGGDNGTWPTMCKHLKLLIMKLRYRGIVLEYCFAPHVTKSGLLHLDGIVFIRRGELSLFELQVMWGELHGATQVNFKRVVRSDRVKQYMVGHMLKDYDKVMELGFKGRMLISRGWMPVGWLRVDKVLCRSALDKVGQLGRAAWVLKNDAYERWLNYEVVTIKEEGRLITIQRKMEV